MASNLYRLLNLESCILYVFPTSLTSAFYVFSKFGQFVLLVDFNFASLCKTMIVCFETHAYNQHAYIHTSKYVHHTLHTYIHIIHYIHHTLHTTNMHILTRYTHTYIHTHAQTEPCEIKHAAPAPKAMKAMKKAKVAFFRIGLH